MDGPPNILFSAVKHMAASLAVEWAKAGVRVNALRCERHISTYCLSNCLSSPGYMLTKLTKTVLEHDQELRVVSFLMPSFAVFIISFQENLGEFDTLGESRSPHITFLSVVPNATFLDGRPRRPSCVSRFSGRTMIPKPS